MNRKYIAAAAVLLAAGYTGGVFAGKSAETLKLIPIEDAKYFPLDPKYPDGAQLAVLAGNPQKGASSILLKLKPGTPPVHSHSASYQAVVISGVAKHWVDGREAAAKPLKAGSYWNQPGTELHGDSCVGPEDCLVYIQMTGAFDFKPKPDLAKK